MNSTYSEILRDAYEEASNELDTAVEHGNIDQARYWLGRKRAVEDLMDELEVGYLER